jgi:hypothetical protein
MEKTQEPAQSTEGQVVQKGSPGNMMEARRRAYLQALGLDVWTLKPPAPSLDRLMLQPGNGRTLLICQAPEETAHRLAGDIARALDQDVVWAWPDPDGREENASLTEAIGQHLFTRVVVFGGALANRVCKGDAPNVIGSASILVTRVVGELAVSGSAKQAFWEQLSLSRLNQ